MLSTIGHTLHYAILALGVLGLGYLLAPLDRLPGARAPRPASAHDVKVAALRAQLGLSEPAPSLPPDPARTGTSQRGELLVTFLTASAGIHAAAAAQHVSQWIAASAFFLCVSGAQMAAAGTILLRGDGVRIRAALGASHIGLVGLWAVSRSTGLPWGPPGPEPLGPWDLTSMVYTLGIVVACLLTIRDRDHSPLSWSLRTWSSTSRLLVAASVVVVLVLGLWG